MENYMKKEQLYRTDFLEKNVKLNAMELSMYDFVIGSTMVLEMGGGYNIPISLLRKGLDWFRTNNSKLT